MTTITQVETDGGEHSSKTRVFIAAMGGQRPDLRTLSHSNDVDFLLLTSRSVGVTVAVERWEDGTCVSAEAVHHHVADPSLITAAVVRLVHEVNPFDTRSLPCLIHQPEAAPTVVETLLGAFASRAVLVFEDTPYNGSILRLENRADRCFVPDEAARKRWASQHVVAAEIATMSDDAPLAALLDGMDVPRAAPVTDDTHRVLLVSYFGPPTTLVSVQRLSYWHDQLTPLAAERGEKLHVEWLTATAAGRAVPRVRSIADPSDQLGEGRRDQLLDMHDLKVPTIGVAWLDAIANAIGSWPDRFDTVIISVGPFGYVDLGEVVKAQWDARVIIDFRDPYGGDARMGFTLDRRTWVNAHERRAIASADAIVSVNDRCLDVIGPGISIPRQIVNNGYDDEAVREAQAGFTPLIDDDFIRLIYCGTIFRQLPLDDVLDALSATRHRLLHAGRDQSPSQALQSHVVGQSLGFITDRIELNRTLLGCDAGIVRVGGEATTATTKIFDYIGTDLDIIIVTDGAPRSGAIHQMTDGLSGVFWVQNDPDELSEFFDSYKPSKTPRPERESFSRRAQTEAMLDLILQNGSPAR